MLGYGDYELMIMQSYEDQATEEYLDWEVEMAVNDRFKLTTKAAEAALNTIDLEDGEYLFVPVGNTRVKILLEPGRVAEAFYQPVLRSYKGKERIQHMMHVLIEDKVKIMCCAKTVTKAILTIMAGGEYDLLDPYVGHGVIITRSGERLKTKYSAMPTKDPIEVDYGTLEFEHKLMDKAAEMEAGDREQVDAEADEVPF